MKKLLLMGMVLGMTSTAMASGWDFLIGAVMLANGGAFEYLRGKAAHEKEDASNKAADNGIMAVQDTQSAYYFSGAADWEYLNFGNTTRYRSLSNAASLWQGNATYHAGTAVTYSDQADSKQKDEHIYKGVSLTSFALGGAFLIKGTAAYLIGRTRIASAKKYRWARNFDLEPNRSLDGADLVYNYKF